jgi:hypothetical protein
MCTSVPQEQYWSGCWLRFAPILVAGGVEGALYKVGIEANHVHKERLRLVQTPLESIGPLCSPSNRARSRSPNSGTGWPITLTGPWRAPTRSPGNYHAKSAFVAATFTRLAGVLIGGVKLEMKQLYVDDETTIVELLSTSRTNEGAAFVNR